MDFYFDNQSGMEIAEEITGKLNKVINLGLTRAGKLNEPEIGISFVTPEEIRRLNREYRAVDAVTDVLSFAYGNEQLNAADETMPMILGDIVICVERAKSQAEEYGHTFEREMAFLTAHGLMHLLGYDHENENDEKAMFAEQEAVLGELGITR